MRNLFVFLFLLSGLATWATKPVPSDPKATPEAVKLYQKMLKQESKESNDPKTLFLKDIQ